MSGSINAFWASALAATRHNERPSFTLQDLAKASDDLWDIRATCDQLDEKDLYATADLYKLKQKMLGIEMHASMIWGQMDRCGVKYGALTTAQLEQYSPSNPLKMGGLYRDELYNKLDRMMERFSTAVRQTPISGSLQTRQISYPLQSGSDTSTSSKDDLSAKDELETRQKNLFTVQTDRIPKMRLGFLGYNIHLMNGLLPTDRAFEQAFGEHLDKNNDALQELEENFETFFNKKCESFEQKVLYLLISYGTLQRLHNISGKTRDRLFALYAKELAKVLRIPVASKELFKNAALFFHLYFHSFKHSSDTDRPFTQSYMMGATELTRFYGKDGNKGPAFVVVTNRFRPMESIRGSMQEKLRQALKEDPILAGFVSRFIPNPDDVKKLLGEKAEKKS